MPFAKRTLDVTFLEDGKFRLKEPLVYRGATQTFIVPAGTVTDFASIPRLVQWLFSTIDPRWALAAVLHDMFCYFPEEYVSSRDADGLFRRIARELGANLVVQWLLWTGVRWGALFNKHRRKGWWRDAPLVLLISALCLLPLILLVLWVVL